MKAVLAVLTLGIAAATFSIAVAQEVPPKAPDAAPASVLNPDDNGDGGSALGKEFESLGLGIALRGPAGSKVIRQVGGTEVDFIHEKNKWSLKVARLTLEQPMPLVSSKSPEGLPTVGLLEVTVDRLKDQLPGATILRQDVVRVGQIPVGMIALRYVKGLETLLSQQALVRSSDKVYFTLTLTSPGSKASGNEAGDDPGERRAVETFGEVLDTIRLLDQRPLVRDQEDRYYATLAFLTNLGGKGKLEGKLIPQQWLRVQRGGKDIGYVYTVEEVADGIPGDPNAALRRKKAAARRPGPDGILVGTRSRTLAAEDTRSDAQSWMFCTPDRRQEEWSTVQFLQNLKDASQFDNMTIVGSSSWRTGVRLDRKAHEQGLRGERDDPNQPPVRETNDHVLSVTQSAKTHNFEPLNQSIPDYYLPQAVSHLLPRLLPLDQPKKYVFAVYVPEVRKVMHRYVDVGEEKRVTLGGNAVRAVPIADRIGVEGSVTTHYMSPEGKYLGSENADTGIAVLPSDEATLLGIWKDAELTRPADVKRDEKSGAASAAPPGAPVSPAAARPAGGEKPIRDTGK
jgi:hypothetical protein